METRKQLTPADIRACAAGLRDGMGGHADYCADIMDQLAKNMAAAEQAQQAEPVAAYCHPECSPTYQAMQPPAVAVAVPDERAAFEAWLQENIDNTDTVRPSKEKVDAYFAVWLARAMLAAAPQAAPLSAALADIVAERRRQMEVEGWTPEHDDAYQEGHLADAAACYALCAHDTGAKRSIPAWWPWRNEWWKPTTARRDLVKAGALIAAEIERLDRAAQKGGAA